MEVRGEMWIGPTEFCVLVAWFAPVASQSGPGWDFHFYAHCADDADAAAYPYGAALVAAGAPVPLTQAADYTGISLRMPEACYRDSGQSWFGLWLDGEYETWQPDLRFVGREEPRHRVEFESGTSVVVAGAYQPLRLSAWAELRTDRPASDPIWGRWPRRCWRPGV